MIAAFQAFLLPSRWAIPAICLICQPSTRRLVCLLFCSRWTLCHNSEGPMHNPCQLVPFGLHDLPGSICIVDEQRARGGHYLLSKFNQAECLRPWHQYTWAHSQDKVAPVRRIGQVLQRHPVRKYNLKTSLHNFVLNGIGGSCHCML